MNKITFYYIIKLIDFKLQMYFNNYYMLILCRILLDIIIKIF